VLSPVAAGSRWLLALLSAAGYAAFIVLGRRLPHTYSSLQINGLAFGLAAVFLLPGTAFAPLFPAYPLWGWGILLYLGVIPTAVGYGLFQIGIRAVPATIVGTATLCEPLTAALLAWLLFHETLGAGGIGGAVLLLGAMGAMLRLPDASEG